MISISLLYNHKKMNNPLRSTLDEYDFVIISSLYH
jgi:hypothetical protein